MRGDGFGRLLAVGLVGSVLALGACSGSAKKATPPSTSTTVVPPTSVAPTSAPASSIPASTSTSAVSTTTTACPAVGSSAPVTTPASQASALLTKVAVTSAGCDDRVEFLYRVGSASPPSCTIGYRAGPFTQDASGAPVAVAGAAFVVVRCYPAYGYDFETGTRTYTGPNRIEATGARHVREIVKTGDNEGVLTWVIGVDARRPFTVSSTATPTKRLAVTFS